jgi:hypothetical protein
MKDSSTEPGSSNQGKAPHDRKGQFLTVVYLLIIVGIFIILVRRIPGPRSVRFPFTYRTESQIRMGTKNPHQAIKSIYLKKR